MVHWNSSPHPISDIRDWSEGGRLELQPDFQRREVWSPIAKIMLMDTILRDVPMPKVFLANSIKENRTYRRVIDGQQRIQAILSFLRDEFALDHPYDGAYLGKKFSELDQATRDRFLSYQIDFNEATNATDSEIREVYSRVNKYTVPLNKQELRRADFPGDFLQVVEDLALEEFFEDCHLFTAADRRRYADVEFVSEILAATLEGIQDKRSSLDNFYIKYSKWPKQDKAHHAQLFRNTLNELTLLFDDNLLIQDTRFKQKSDFYTVFLVVHRFLADGKTLKGKNIDDLQKDMQILDHHIRPESAIEACREYAIKCVSQANSASSRRFRDGFIRSILAGTYEGVPPSPDAAYIYYDILEGTSAGDICPGPTFECPACSQEISGDLGETEACVIGWHGEAGVYQLSNACWVHVECADQSGMKILQRPPPKLPEGSDTPVSS